MERTLVWRCALFPIQYGFGWSGQFSGGAASQPNYNPWSSWSNNLAPGGNGSGMPTPYGQQTWDAVDSYVASGRAPDQVPQMQQTADYMRRLQVMQALGPEAARRIPNWRTMPFNDFLLAAARLKGVKPTQNAQPGQRLPVEVSAHAYWEGDQRVTVSKVNVWDLGATEQSFYNGVGQTDFTSRFDKGVKGKRYRVTVEWENGRTYAWDHLNDGNPIQIWRPNQ